MTPLLPHSRRVRLAVVSACLVGVGLGGCADQPRVPDWTVNARDSLQRSNDAYLQGHTRVAQAEGTRARAEAARSALPEQVARVLLAQCAARVASLDWTASGPECPEVAALNPQDLSPALQVYPRYLAAQLQAAELALLPAAQQPVARLMLTGPTGGADGAGGAGSAGVRPTVTSAQAAAVLTAVTDPLSRLVGAAVWLRAQLPSTLPAQDPVVVLAVDTASAQGWSRPLMAWLGWQAQRAEETGQTELAARLRRRMDLLVPATPTTPSKSP